MMYYILNMTGLIIFGSYITYTAALVVLYFFKRYSIVKKFGGSEDPSAHIMLSFIFLVVVGEGLVVGVQHEWQLAGIVLFLLTIGIASAFALFGLFKLFSFIRSKVPEES